MLSAGLGCTCNLKPGVGWTDDGSATESNIARRLDAELTPSTYIYCFSGAASDLGLHKEKRSWWLVG